MNQLYPGYDIPWPNKPEEDDDPRNEFNRDDEDMEKESIKDNLL